MRYILINFWESDTPEIVTHPHGDGPLVINPEKESLLLLTQKYPNAIVVPLSKNLIVWEVDDSIPDDWDDETKWPPKSDTTVYL